MRYDDFPTHAICTECHRAFRAIERAPGSGDVHVPWHKSDGKTCQGYRQRAIDAEEVALALRYDIPLEKIIEYRQSISSDYFWMCNEEWAKQFEMMEAIE